MNKELLQSTAVRIGATAVACVLALVAVFYLQQGMVRDEQSRQSAERAAGAFSAMINGLVTSAESVGSLVSVPDQPAAQDGATTHAELVALEPLGIADPEFDASGFAGHVEVNLIGDAHAGRRPLPEIYSDDGKKVLAIARPILADADGRGGVLLIKFPLDALLKNLTTSLGSDGSLSIYAGGNGDGPASGPGAEVRAATGIGNIEIGFSPDPDSSVALGMFLPLTAVGLLAIAALAAIGLISDRTLRKRLVADAFRLTNTIRRGDGGHKQMSLAELQPLANNIETLLKVGVEAADASAAGEAVEAPDQSSVAAPDPIDDDPLELDGSIDDAWSAPVPANTDGGIDVNAVPASIPDEIFRAYDIRGRAKLFSAELIVTIGRAIGTEARLRGCTDIVIGGDGRVSYGDFREHLNAGLLSTGINVIDIGIVASPMLYFACHHLKTMTGVMITGSHNPPDHNGFKIMIDGEFICGDRITDLKNRIEARDFVDGDGEYAVSVIDRDYIDAIVGDVVVNRGIKVVVDCGNGAGGVIAEELFEALGCEVIPMFCELDPSFPNHQPDPAEPENLTALIGEVRRMKADIGIAFDGDADRIGVVTAKGKVINADHLIMLLAKEILGANPGSTVVFDVKCTSDMLSVIAKAGGVPLMWRSGHSWIKQKMKDIDAVLGGEFTGHICFRDRWYGFDDAFYCAARLLEMLSNRKRSLDDLKNELPRMVGTSEQRIKVSEADKFNLERRLIDGMKLPDAQLFKFDGLRAEYRDGWGLIRASNTSATLTCRFEGRDNDALHRIQEQFRNEIKRLVPGTEVPF